MAGDMKLSRRFVKRLLQSKIRGVEKGVETSDFPLNLQGKHRS